MVAWCGLGMSRCYGSFAVVLLAAGLLGSAASPVAQPPAMAPAWSDGIGFIRLLFTGEGVTVLDVTTRPGRLKQRRTPPEETRRAARGYLVVEVRTSEGALVWTDVVGDPLLERLEYVNDEGELETLFVSHERAEVTVRVPVVTARQTVAFFRSEGGDVRPVAEVEVTL